MENVTKTPSALSPRWRNGVVWTFVIGLTVLIFMSVQAYRNIPPIPEKVIGPTGDVIFTGDDISAGQEVFLKYGLMENGTIWGHGSYLGPDFSAAYLLHSGSMPVKCSRWRCLDAASAN